jgi:vesicle-associated membrane protein 7/small nuclear ribonucleoprotein D3
MSATQIPQKIKALKSRAGERDKLRTPYGFWFVTHDDNDISYAVCTSETYPERHAYGLIEKLQEKIGEINHC